MRRVTSRTDGSKGMLFGKRRAMTDEIIPPEIVSRKKGKRGTLNRRVHVDREPVRRRGSVDVHDGHDGGIRVKNFITCDLVRDRRRDSRDEKRHKC